MLLFLLFLLLFYVQRVSVPRPVALANPPSPVRTRSNSRPKRVVNNSNRSNSRPKSVVNYADRSNSRPDSVVNYADRSNSRPDGVVNYADRSNSRPDGVVNYANRSNSTPERVHDITYIFIPVAVDTNMTNAAPPCVVNTTENENFLVTEDPNFVLPPTYDEALEFLQDTEGND